MDHYWICPKCGFQDLITQKSLSVCKICTGSTITRQPSKSTEEDEEKISTMKVPVSVDNSVNSQYLSVELFEDATGKLNIINESKCEVNCKSFMRLQQLCNVFSVHTESTYQQIFDELSDYSLTTLINDSIHLMECHDIQSINELIGSCTKAQNCHILESRSRSHERKSLLIKEMEKIHCYLFHNIHRKEEKNAIQIDRKQKYNFKNIQSAANESKIDDKMEEKYDEYGYNEYGFGSFIYYDLLRAKYPTFKQELLNNEMYCIGINEWNDTFEKAKEYMTCEKAKKLIHKQTERMINIQHLISIISYTDDAQLCDHFRKSFRKLHSGESNKDIMERHCNNYYHFGKWLNDTVTYYGLLVSQYVNENENEIKLYCGLNCKFLFKSLCTDFNIPTSTTTEISVANTFAGNGGLILQLQSKWKHGSMWNKAKCLPVDWISLYNEKEVLFFGNFNQLLIINIIFITPMNDEIENLRHVLEAIHLWEFICDGYVGDVELNMVIADEAFTVLKMLITMQNVRAVSGNNTNNQIPHYILQLFNYICLEKKIFSLQGFCFLMRICEDKNHVIYKLLELFFIDVPVFDIPHCGHPIYKGTIGKASTCEGCKNNHQNAEGFLCSNCSYRLCNLCRNIIVNILIILPNACHQYEVNRLDGVKSNALKIELLRSAGLW